jgi:hypothetical protein
MNRIHRSLVRRARKIDASKVANSAEDYLEDLKFYKNELRTQSGLRPKAIRNMIKRVDQLEREIIRAENKVETLIDRRNIAAAKLQEELEYELKVFQENMEE